MFDIEIFGETVTVKTSNHYSEKREYERWARNERITEDHLEEIVRSAFKNGITEFRNKGEVGVMFKNFKGRTYGLLCELKDSTLSVITLVHTKKSHHDVFSRDKSIKTIFLREYVLRKMTEEDKHIKALENLADNIRIVSPLTVLKNKPKLRIKRKKNVN